MSELYPLLMTPLFDPRPWGTHDLSPIYPRQFSEKIGESWLTGDKCKVQNGSLAGKSLAQLSEKFQRELVGEAAPDSARFPLLAKFLFPHEKLSVQVHPDDGDAVAIGQPWGKTECWYVAQSQPGSQLALGLKPGTTRAQFEAAIHKKHAEEFLNWITVSAGDMIYVAGGTVHTLGPGMIVVETQQQSDTTFRLYDYGRPRELHLEHGLRVIKERPASGKVKSQPCSKLGANGNRTQKLVSSRYFVVERFELHAEHTFDAAQVKTTPHIMVVVSGGMRVEAAGCDPVSAKTGDAIVIPASVSKFKIRPEPQVEFLKSFVPSGFVSEPEI